MQKVHCFSGWFLDREEFAWKKSRIPVASNPATCVYCHNLTDVIARGNVCQLFNGLRQARSALSG